MLGKRGWLDAERGGQFTQRRACLNFQNHQPVRYAYVLAVQLHEEHQQEEAQ
jgi:hypothetical protein